MAKEKSILFRDIYFFIMIGIIILITCYRPKVGIILTIVFIIYYYNIDENNKNTIKNKYSSSHNPDKLHLEENMRPKCSSKQISDKINIKSSKEPKAFNPSDENKNLTLL